MSSHATGGSRLRAPAKLKFSGRSGFLWQTVERIGLNTSRTAAQQP
jgi:hypothetical protein